MKLTVGRLVEMLSKYPKDVELVVGCDNCHHGASGTEDIITIRENLDQTFGYIDLRLNSTWINKDCKED